MAEMNSATVISFNMSPIQLDEINKADVLDRTRLRKQNIKTVKLRKE